MSENGGVVKGVAPATLKVLDLLNPLPALPPPCDMRVYCQVILSNVLAVQYKLTLERNVVFTIRFDHCIWLTILVGMNIFLLNKEKI